MRSAPKLNHQELEGSILTIGKLQRILTIAEHLNPVMVYGFGKIYHHRLKMGSVENFVRAPEFDMKILKKAETL